jgi:protein CpxP
MARLAQHLELTAEQRQQIQALRQEMQQELEATNAQIREIRQQIRQEWLSGQPDEQTLLTLHREMNTLRQVVQERQIRLRLAVHSILTPEQQQRAAELAERRMARGQNGRRGGGTGHRGPGGPQGQHLDAQ